MVMSALFDNLEPSHSTRPNHGLFEEASRHGGKLEDKSGVSLVPERTSDLVAITTFSLSRYVYASPSHKRVLGYDPSDLLNRCPFDFIHPDDIPKLSPLLDKYVASLSKADAPHGDLKVPTERMLYRIMDKWGNWRSMETTGDFLSDELIVLISRDVTERVKAENDLSESLTALQNAAEEHARELTSADEALRESERKYRTDPREHRRRLL
jgi:PAS domain S-box-containing protein